MFEILRSDLRILSLLRRAVIAWETMARIMQERRKEEIESLAAEAKKSTLKHPEFGTLDIAEVNRNWKLARQADFLDDEDEEEAG